MLKHVPWALAVLALPAMTSPSRAQTPAASDGVELGCWSIAGKQQRLDCEKRQKRIEAEARGTTTATPVPAIGPALSPYPDERTCRKLPDPIDGGQMCAVDDLSLPLFAVDENCANYASTGTTPQLKTVMRNSCVESEQTNYNIVRDIWDQVPDEIKRACLPLPFRRRQIALQYGTLVGCVRPRYNAFMESQGLVHFDP